MARRGFGSTALRAALGAAVGVGEGLQQREVLAEQKRQRTLLEQRQKAQDEAAIREEERQLIGSGFIPASQLPLMNIPGESPLSPMEPMTRQTVSGKEYVYSPSIVKALARAEKNRDMMEEDKQLAADIAAAQKGGRRSVAAIKLRGKNKSAYEAIYPEQTKEGQLTPYQKMQLEQDMDEAEAIFGMRGLDPARSKAMSSAFNALRKTYPTRPARELILMAVKAGGSVKETPTSKYGGRFNAPPTTAPQKPAAKPAAPIAKDEFDAAIEGMGD